MGSAALCVSFRLDRCLLPSLWRPIGGFRRKLAIDGNRDRPLPPSFFADDYVLFRSPVGLGTSLLLSGIARTLENPKEHSVHCVHLTPLLYIEYLWRFLRDSLGVGISDLAGLCNGWLNSHGLYSDSPPEVRLRKSPRPTSRNSYRRR